ncbi:MAG: hypothetical protein J6Y64_00955 [Ruminococcus sp.]|nr:hypothetical protein [Ruminococcus sp.]
MKFRINHETPLFHYGVTIPLIVPVVALLLYLFFELNVNDFGPTMVLAGITALSCVIELLSIILFFGEKIWGGKIIVENDRLDIRLFLRRKKIRFDKIDDVKYTHYEITENHGSERRRHSRNIFVRYHADDVTIRVRAKLIIYLSSGKKFILNDDASGYAKKRKLWITEPDLDPDEDVRLYQAYQCYLSASRQYWLNQQ